MKGLCFILTVLLAAGCAQTHEHHVPVADGVPTGEHAKLRIPKRVEVLSVDGNRLQTRSLLPMRESHVLLLEPGKHRITARPRASMDLSDEEHGIMMGAAVTLQFEVEADLVYRLVYNPNASADRDAESVFRIEALSDE